MTAPASARRTPAGSDAAGPVIRIAILDDQRLVREAVALLLSQDPGLDVTIHDSAATLLQTADDSGLDWDVALLCPSAPDHPSLGLAAEMIRAHGPDTVRVILCVARITSEIRAEARRIGVRGLVTKTMPIASVAAAIRLVHSGEVFIPAGDEPEDRRPANLTRQELRTLQHLAEGLTNKEIAQRMGLSEPTVKMHLSAVRTKLGARNRTQATMFARQRGIL